MFENSVLNEVLNFESQTDLIATIDVDKNIIEQFFDISLDNSVGLIGRIKVDYLAIEVLIHVASFYDDMVELKLSLRNTQNNHTNIGKRLHASDAEIDAEGLLIRVKLIAGLTFLMILPRTVFTGYYNEGSDIVYGDELFSYSTDDLFGSHPELITKFDINKMEDMFSYLWFRFPQDLTSVDDRIKNITLEEMIY